MLRTRGQLSKCPRRRRSRDAQAAAGTRRAARSNVREKERGASGGWPVVGRPRRSEGPWGGGWRGAVGAACEVEAVA